MKLKDLKLNYYAIGFVLKKENSNNYLLLLYYYCIMIVKKAARLSLKQTGLIIL